MSVDDQTHDQVTQLLREYILPLRYYQVEQILQEKVHLECVLNNKVRAGKLVLGSIESKSNFDSSSVNATPQKVEKAARILVDIPFNELQRQVQASKHCQNDPVWYDF